MRARGNDVADIDALVASLTLDEKTALLAGEDLWSTVAVERVGVPKITVTDGPNGARDPGIPGMSKRPSACIPCGSALGATWDPELVEQLGALLGMQARQRGCRVLLAPTMNLHRSPLAGRNFECYSEDPLLSGKQAAAYIRGVQSQGVIATAKHFVGNDAEFERNTINSVIDDRALRELYLVPFEHAVRDGGVLALMTAYNRVNGHFVTERADLLRDLVRAEWGFEGLVMTDWFGIADTIESIAAGLDLEMPGPGRAYGTALAAAVTDGSVKEVEVDAAVRRLLSTFDRVGALDDAPDVPFEPPTDDDIALMRRAAADAMVLLHNDGALPLDVASLRRVAVIGPNAQAPCIMGGGSAEVTPYPVQSPLDALRDALGDAVTVTCERGCDIDRSPRPLGSAGLPTIDGFEVELFATAEPEGEPVDTYRVDTLRVLQFGGFDAAPTGDASMRIRGSIVAPEAGEYTLAMAQAGGAARVRVGGIVVLDGVSNPPPPGGPEFFGMASQDLVATAHLDAGVPTDVEVTFSADSDFGYGVRVGFRLPEASDLLERAVESAAAADVAIVVVGTTREWETEGHDREGFALPGDQAELIRRVAATGRPTVVVVNAASPVDLSWCDDVAATVQCWFGGQEIGAAIADVLTGATEPGGRLPTTIPVRIEHNPSFDNFPGENGEVRYGESVFMGYRGYDHRAIEPRYAFGHGLGYTTFALGEPTVSARTFAPGDSLVLSVPVTNTGARAGSTVVQCYVAPQSPRLVRPPKELKAFVKVRLDAGVTETVELVLDDRSFAVWDPGEPGRADLEARHGGAGLPQQSAERRAPGWYVDPGAYDLLIGLASDELRARATVEVEDTE